MVEKASPPFKRSKGYCIYDLEERLLKFSVIICHLTEKLPPTRIGDHISRQILRSGTSPAPNYGEAQGAESRRDFIHKMKICLKELRETKIWLQLIHRLKIIRNDKLHILINESDELIAIFVKSIETAQKNAAKSQ